MTRLPHIVCDPNPFCYGSISALRAIAAELPGARWSCAQLVLVEL